MRARVVTSLVAIALATATVVSGCSSNPTPTALGDSGQKADGSGTKADSSKADEPESEQPAAPAMPELATSHLDKGAGAFVRHFIALYNYGLDTGDHKPVEATTEADCDACAELYPPAPQRIEGAHWQPAGPLSYGVDKDPYTAKVFLPIKTAAGKLYENENADPTTLAAHSWTLEATLSWKGDTWGIKALYVGES